MNKETTIIQDKLLKIGIAPNLLGFGYIVTAAELILENGSRMRNITKDLYPSIAKVHHTTSSCVERAIRTAILHALNDEYEAITTNLKTYPNSNGNIPGTHFLAAFVLMLQREL